MEGPQPNVEFTETVDGRRIAFWEVGSGPPLVMSQQVITSHPELEWAFPSMRRLYLELGKHFRVIRFDHRGAGLSDDVRSEVDFKQEAYGRDIDAVAGALGLESFILSASLPMGPRAIMYTAEQPERILGLALCDTGPVIADLPLAKYIEALLSPTEFYLTPQLAEMSIGMADEDQQWFIALLEHAMFRSRDVDYRPTLELDATAVIDQVQAPTLVLKCEESVFTDTAQTQRLVEGIKGAQLRIVPGTIAPFLADHRAVAEAFVSVLAR